MGHRGIYLLLFLSWFSLVSCQTLYYPTQEFTKKSYKPIKKGTIELMVVPRMVSTFSTPTDLFDYSTAYRKGERYVKRSMQKFCGGEYEILSAVKKKEKIRMETHTSTSSYFDSDTQRSDLSQDVDVLQVHQPRGRVYRNRRGRKVFVQPFPQAQVRTGTQSVGHESQSGSVHGGSSTITKPVYRRYIKFKFQCK